MAFRPCCKLVLCLCIRVGWWGGIQAVLQACFVPLYSGRVVGGYSGLAASLFCVAVLG